MMSLYFFLTIFCILMTKLIEFRIPKRRAAVSDLFVLQLACIDHDIDFKKDNSSMFVSVKHFLNTFVMTNCVDYLNLYVDGC